MIYTPTQRSAADPHKRLRDVLKLLDRGMARQARRLQQQIAAASLTRSADHAPTAAQLIFRQVNGSHSGKGIESSWPCTAPDMDILARLCRHSPHQTAGLLELLLTMRTLASSHHSLDREEVY